MKKSVLIATGLALLSSSAYATQTRMASLGQDEARGSHYIDDSRNVFRNAAHAGSMTNYVVMEYGSDSTGATAGDAEGGFFKEAGAFNYGVYLNDKSDSQNDKASGGTNTGYAGTGTYGSSGFVDRTDNLDLFFAGDMGFQWGARLGYTKSNDKTGAAGAAEQEHSGMSLGAGVIFGDISGSVNFVLSDEYKNDSATAGAKNEGSAMDVDLAYAWGSWTFWGHYSTKGLDFTSGTGATAQETTQNTLQIGAGHTHEVSSTARIYSDVSYTSTKGEDKTTAATTEVTTTGLKANIAFEVDANSWLTWRSAISQNVLIDKQEEKTTAQTDEDDNGSTTLNAGATLNFGKLKVDGGLTAEADGGLDLDNVLTNVAVHYWF